MDCFASLGTASGHVYKKSVFTVFNVNVSFLGNHPRFRYCCRTQRVCDELEEH